jgi:uncharacterized protein YcfL
MWTETEDELYKSGKFCLPGKKALLEDNDIKVVSIDVTETSVERPKKTTQVVFRKEEATYNKNTVRSRYGIYWSNLPGLDVSSCVADTVIYLARTAAKAVPLVSLLVRGNRGRIFNI